MEPEDKTKDNKSFDFEVNELDSDFAAKSWDAFVALHPMSKLYYQSDFLLSIHRSLGHRILLFSLRQRSSGKLEAVLPIVEQKSFLFGHLWTSIALVNYGGVLARDSTAEQVLLEHVKALARKEHVKRLEIRGLYKRPIVWTVNEDKASMWLRLPESGSSVELLQSFRAKLRSQIKKGYSDKVTTKIGGVELLNDFYKVFARNMRDLGTPVYGKGLFQNLLIDLEANTHLVVVYYAQKPASAAFLLESGKTMEIPWASTVRDYNPLNLNMVLYWEVLQYSCQRKCDIFDFGRSSVDASTYKFKKQWGAHPVQHYWYSCEPDGGSSTTSQKPSRNPTNTNNPKFQFLIKAWRRLPLWLAKLLGPHIVKYIP